EIPWLATEYVMGPSLQHLVDTAGPLPEPSAVHLARGIAQALTDLHAQGLAHRDLKPANVMIAPAGPQVIDFGIARAMADTHHPRPRRRRYRRHTRLRGPRNHPWPTERPTRGRVRLRRRPRLRPHRYRALRSRTPLLLAVSGGQRWPRPRRRARIRASSCRRGPGPARVN